MSKEREENLFYSILSEAYKKRQPMDVVKLKREEMCSRLRIAERALKKKDHMCAFTFLLNIYQDLENDQYADEYGLEHIEFDMVRFSMCIAYLAIFLDKRETSIIFNLIDLMRKYHNPIFYYIFALIHFKQDRFNEARKYMQEALTLSDGHKNDVITWPGTEISITSLGIHVLRQKITCFLAIEHFKENFQNTVKDFKPEEINLHYSYEVCSIDNRSINNIIKFDIYNLVRKQLDKLLDTDFSAPSSLIVNDEKVSGKKNEKKLEKKKESKEKKTVQKKHQSIQIKPQTNRMATQTSFETCSVSTQTVKDESGKKTVENLKRSLELASSKQKAAENNVNSLKEKIKELQCKLNEANECFSQQRKKWLYKDQDQHLQITKLQAKYEISREKEEKMQHELIEQEIFYKTLLTKAYESNVETQREFYQYIQGKCGGIIETLNTIKNDVDTNTLPSFAECSAQLNEWEMYFQKCKDKEECLVDGLLKIKALISKDLLADVYTLPTLPCSSEPKNLIQEYFPVLLINNNSQQIALENHRISLNSNSAGVNYNKENTDLKSNDRTQKEEARNSSSNFSLPEPHYDTNKKLQSLCTYLKTKIPSKTEAEIMAALRAFREQNMGTLSGLTFHYILYNVYKILYSSKSAWSVVKSNFKEWESDNDTTCSICFDSFEVSPTTTLVCKHRFHTHCIKTWIATNSVCAICRVFVTLDEDFPPLKS